jgi:hypothetical protein
MNRIAIRLLIGLLLVLSLCLSLALIKPGVTAKQDQRRCSNCALRSKQIIYTPIIDLPEAQGCQWRKCFPNLAWLDLD